MTPLSGGTEATDPAALAAAERLMSLYGHLLDERAFDRLVEVFTDDVVFVSPMPDAPTTTSLAELVERWSAPSLPHPVAHHATNVVVLAEDEDGMDVVSKGLALEADGRAWSVVYRDALRRTGDGWRIARRAVEVRPRTFGGW
jgi:ketosteroid isomerase-like protein